MRKTKNQMDKEHENSMIVLEKIKDEILPIIAEKKFAVPAAIGLYVGILTTLVNDYINSRDDIDLKNEETILKCFISNISFNFNVVMAEIHPIIAPKIHPDSYQEEENET